MGFDRDDPRLTAYALGEMPEGERAAFEKVLAGDASLAAEVKAIASLGRELEAELDRHAPGGLGEARRGDIVAAVRGVAPSTGRTKLRVVDGGGEGAKVTPPVTTPASSVRWRIWVGVSGLAVAAAALFFVSTRDASMKGSSPAASAGPPEQANAAATAMAKSPAAKPDARFGIQAGDQPAADDGTAPKAKDRGEVVAPEATASAAPPCDARDPWCGHKGGPVPAGFVSTSSTPTSTFTLESEPGMVEVASALHRGIVPARSDVHIGGMVNAFHYSYPAPESGYALATDVAGAPWEPSHRVLRIGVQGPRNGAAPPIEGNRVTVAFDGKSVVAYRFVGDGRAASATDSDGRATATGGSFTALFEVVPQGGATPSAPEHLADVSLHYADRSGQTLGVSTRANDTGSSFAGASSDFRFAVSVAGFGLLLSGDAGPRYSYDDVVTMATAARANGFDGAGNGFIDMVQSAKALSRK